ncbi:hypothetical protein SDC9_131692 [bioreactor metagenome]|uniref:Uncharacterized protein n=1 Tax=bioreactor metagenome TaxID=1076179 RepID=A0A645D5X9_9ZZZZ
MAHEEAAIRPRDGELVAHLQRFVQPRGARAAGHVAHVELDLGGEAVRTRCVGNRERAALADGGNLHLHVLPCLVVHGLVERKVQCLDGGRELLDARDRGLEVAHRDDQRIGLVLDVGFDGGVGQQRGAAGQRLAIVALHVHERERIGGAVVHLAVADLHLAGAAQAVSAGMRDIDALPQRGIQQGLAFFHLDGGAQRFQCQLIAHVVSSAFMPQCEARRSLAKGARDAGQARRAKADHVLVAQAVVGQAARRIGLPGLARLEPFDGVPVDAREVGVRAVHAGQHRLCKRAEGRVRRQRQAHGRAEHQVVFPADVEQRCGEVLALVLGVELVGVGCRDAHAAPP